MVLTAGQSAALIGLTFMSLYPDDASVETLMHS